MYAVSVLANHRKKVFVLESSTPFKNLREQLTLAFQTEKFKVTAKLGDILVDVTNEEEFQVLSAYHEGTVLPVEGSVRSTQENVELKFADPADPALFWVGHIPTGTTKDDLASQLASALGGKVEVGMLETHVSGDLLALVSVPTDQDEKQVVKRISAQVIGDHHLTATAANAIQPVEVEVKITSPKVGKKGKKATGKKLTSVVQTPILLKAWKAEYLKKVCRNDLSQIAASLNVQITWASATSLSLSGNGQNVKDARKQIEDILSEVSAFGQLMIPCPDASFKIRVINMCRVLEKDLGVVLMMDNLLSQKEESKEDANAVKVLVVGHSRDQFDAVRKKLTAIPKQMFEIKCGFGKKQTEEFKKLKASNPEKIAEIKAKNQVYGIKIIKGNVFLRGTIKESLEEAERKLRALLPNPVPFMADSPRTSLDVFADAFVAPLSPRNADGDSQGSLPEIDVSQIRALNPRDDRLTVDALSSPRDADSPTASPLSPSRPSALSFSSDEANKNADIEEEDNFHEETVDVKAEAVEEDPDKLELDPDLPESWDPMPKQVNCIAALVEPDSEEFNMVKNSLDFISVIKSVERIQNKSLFREFQKTKQEYAASGKPTDSQYLWCGTMSIVPEEVYDSEKGFKQEVNGKSVFQFWKKASYSNVFAYSTTDGSKQLFLTEVLTGGRSRMQVKGVPAYPAYLVTIKMKA